MTEVWTKTVELRWVKTPTGAAWLEQKLVSSEGDEKWERIPVFHLDA